MTKKQSNVIVSVGRISPTKGYEYLIEAFKKVVRSTPYLTLKIIGSADKSKMDYFNHLKSLVSRYALNYNVHFVEFREDIQNAIVVLAQHLAVPEDHAVSAQSMVEQRLTSQRKFPVLNVAMIAATGALIAGIVWVLFVM